MTTSHVNPARDSWKILPALAAMSALVVYGISVNIVFAVLVRAANEFKLRPELFANVSAVHFLGFFAASILGGITADRIGKKRMLQLACLLLCAGALAWAVAATLVTVFIGSAIMGIGGGVLESMNSALLTDLFPDRRKFYLNVSQVAYCAGAVAGPAVMARLMPLDVSWRIFFCLTAVSALVLLVLFSLARVPNTTKETTEAFTAATRKQAIANWSFIAPCLAIFLYVFSEMSIATFVNVFLQKHYHAPEEWAVAAIALFWGGMALGRILCAFIPESMPGQRVVPLLCVLASAFIVAQYFVHSWQTSVICFVLSAFCMSGIWPLIIALTTTLNPRYSGTVVGITVACGSLACVLAPPIVGGLLITLHPPLAIALLALPLMIGAVLLASIPVQTR